MPQKEPKTAQRFKRAPPVGFAWTENRQYGAKGDFLRR
jgi:hypothetical protein